MRKTVIKTHHTKLQISERETLKDAYRRKLLAEKVRRLDEKIVTEAAAATLLEALSKADFAQATKILKKLNGIGKAAQTSGATELSRALKKAADEINELAGGSESVMGLIKKGAASFLKKLTGFGTKNNPILKSATLLSSLEEGLSYIPQIIENNFPDFDKSKTDISLSQQIEESQKEKGAGNKIEINIRKQIVNALKPAGIYSKIKSIVAGASGIPYIDNVEKIAQQLVDIKLENRIDIIDAAVANPVSVDAAETARRFAQENQASQRTGASSGNVIRNAKDFAAAIEAALDDAGKEVPSAVKDDPQKVTSAFVDVVLKKVNTTIKNINVSEDDVKKVLAVLAKSAKLKTKFVLEHKSISVLTKDHVRTSISMYLESGGSSRQWVNMLIEDSENKNDTLVDVPQSKNIALARELAKSLASIEPTKIVAILDAIEEISWSPFEFKV
jgi:hypothetical protein